METARIDTTLHLAQQQRERLVRWAREGYPFEVCGLLIGRAEAGRVEVLDVARARNRNAARAHDRYDLDPEDQLRAELSARARGLEVVGIWHTHPDHPALPSETDRAAAWEGWSYLILSVAAGVVLDLRSWRLRGEGFAEETLE